jgi:hypothetical protein
VQSGSQTIQPAPAVWKHPQIVFEFMPHVLSEFIAAGPELSRRQCLQNLLLLRGKTGLRLPPLVN